MEMNELKAELSNDPTSIGYLPLFGEREVFEHAGPASAAGVHEGEPIKVKRVMKLVGNDAKNADVLNRKNGDKSRAEFLWGLGVIITAQDVANAMRE